MKSTIVEKSLGKKFGKLIVSKFIEFRQTPKRANVPIVECICECGKLKHVSLWDVRCGKTKTCGFDHPHYEDRSLPAFNSLYYRYKLYALKRGFIFELTKEKVKELTKENCHYCGCSPSNLGKKTTGYKISEYLNNGLDRMDNKKGYTVDNVVPCCSICNHAKHTMTYHKFNEWLNRIVVFKNKNNNPIT